MRKALAATVIAIGLAVAPAIDAVHAQDDTTTDESDDGGKWGLLGLAGLLGLGGLAGLKRRDDRYDNRRDVGATGTGAVR